MNKKKFITWDDVDRFIYQLIEYILNNKKKYTGVYGVPRGGLVLAVILSYRMNIPLLTAPCPGCLVIDEIAATGATLQNYNKRYDIAVMHYFKDSQINIIFCDQEITDEWTVYPWE